MLRRDVTGLDRLEFGFREPVQEVSVESLSPDPERPGGFVSLLATRKVLVRGVLPLAGNPDRIPDRADAAVGQDRGISARFEAPWGTPYLLVLQREQNGAFAQQSRLEDGKHRSQSFAATASHGHYLGGLKAAPAGDPKYIRIRPALRADGSMLGPEGLAELQKSIRYESDGYAMDILANELPRPK